MPTDDLEREIRDLAARILEAGRRSGERAATDRVVAIVNKVVAMPSPAPASEKSGPTTRAPDLMPAIDMHREAAWAEPPSSPAPHAGGVNGAGPPGERLPPYWRPR